MTPGAYLDHAATTPMSAAALAAFVEEAQRPGNASSLHAAGREARRVVEESRETVAHALGARPSEVIFTGGGTEADNLAIKGIFWGRRAQDTRRTRVLVSAVEHHAVLDPAFWLAGHAGAEIVLLPVDGEGRLDLDALRADLAAHAAETALVSVMWANNEVGTVQPIREVVRLAHQFGVPVHTDAVQAVGQLAVDFAASGVDALTLSAHKLGGPLGVGALLARRDLAIEAVQHGGGQERGVRSGTLDVPAIRAFAVAVEEAVRTLPERAAHLATLRDALVAGVRRAVPTAVLRGPEPLLPDDAGRGAAGCAPQGASFASDADPGTTAADRGSAAGLRSAAAGSRAFAESGAAAADRGSAAGLRSAAAGSRAFAESGAAAADRGSAADLRSAAAGSRASAESGAAAADRGSAAGLRSAAAGSRAFAESGAATVVSPAASTPAAVTRLPANAHFTFPGAEGDSLLYLLDSAGVQASTGSACQAGVPQPSHVLLAMGVPEAEARGALRFSLGVTSTADDVAALLGALPAVVARAQAAGLVGKGQA